MSEIREEFDKALDAEWDKNNWKTFDADIEAIALFCVKWCLNSILAILDNRLCKEKGFHIVCPDCKEIKKDIEAIDELKKGFFDESI